MNKTNNLINLKCNYKTWKNKVKKKIKTLLIALKNQSHKLEDLKEKINS